MTAAGTTFVPEPSRVTVLTSGAAGGIDKRLLSGGPGIRLGSEIGWMTGEFRGDWEGVLKSIEEKLRSVRASYCL